MTALNSRAKEAVTPGGGGGGGGGVGDAVILSPGSLPSEPSGTVRAAERIAATSSKDGLGRRTWEGYGYTKTIRFAKRK